MPSHRVASLLSASYVAVVLGGVFMHYFLTGDAYTLRFSLFLPSTIIVSAIGGVVAWGLWFSFRWAFWLGLGAVLVQLAQTSLWLKSNLSASFQPGLGVYLVIGILLCLLLALLTPATRTSCSR